MDLPISQAVVCHDTLHTGGVSPVVDNEAPGGFGQQVRTAFEKLHGIVRSQGFEFKDLILMTVYVKDMSYYDELNSVYGELVSPPHPARKVVTTDFADARVLVEMTAIAKRGVKRYLRE